MNLKASIILVAFAMLILSACQSTNNTTLQIMGFKSDVSTETDAIPQINIFYYDSAGYLRINQVPNFSDTVYRPSEANLGQFGMTALGHANNTELITEAEINVFGNSNCGIGDDKKISFGELGPKAVFNDPNGQGTIDINRNISFSEIITEIHTRLKAKNPDCISPANLYVSGSGKAIVSIINIEFKVKKKSGGEPIKRTLRFNLQSGFPLSIPL